MVEGHLTSGFEPEVARYLGVLWGKSKERAGGQTNLLLSHLLDTAAVAEQIWDHFLAPSTRTLVGEIAGGPERGRRFFAWLCGVHDCGKATPVHQRLWSEGGRAVQQAGLTWHEPTTAKSKWRHDKAGGNLVRRLLSDAGWPPEHVDWIWPLVAGHHGVFPSDGQLQEQRKCKGQLMGTGRWPEVQRAVLEVFTRELGFADLVAVKPVRVPSRAAQLHLSGLVVMADWIASDEDHFKGEDDLGKVCLASARRRAEAAWKALALRRGWGSVSVPGPEFFQDRFGHPPRASQVMVVEAARRMEGPGLLVVEAPMGEGKTKTALAAAEVLAARFGADGIFVGMPTQATSDPMFSEVRAWLSTIDADLAAQVALLHGKRMFNKEWKALLEAAGPDPDRRFGSVDECGMCIDDDPFGRDAATFGAEAAWDTVLPERQAPAQWFLGAKRGLLCPFVVGTIDQLLFAATRTKHVMLRMAGLAGKVVVLDEVHAADVYMSQFLKEGLRWLGQARVPVILLSATLAPGQRRELIEAYLAGAVSQEEYRIEGAPEPQGYPCLTAAWLDPDGATPRFLLDSTPTWRSDLPVRVEVLPEKILGRRAAREEKIDAQDAADRAVADLLEDRLIEGGCALVIRNTVARAQSAYVVLRERFGGDVRLLHAQLTVQDRADRTRQCLDLLGPEREPESNRKPGATRSSRPSRLVLVATQLAEQSFDVDVDLLISDLTTIDLLLQRIGRLHRHSGVKRPVPVHLPRVVVTGFSPGDGEAPSILSASEKIYGRYLLLRSAAEVLSAVGASREISGAGGVGGKWSIPSQVPELVRRVYDDQEDVVPSAWAEAEESARQEWAAGERVRADHASAYLLTRLGEHENSTLAGLHFAGASAGSGENSLEAVVRDGPRSVEVILVVWDGGIYRTLAGRPLTANGDVAHDLLDEVLGSTVRLPVNFTDPALNELRPLPAWHGHPWLRYSLALVLDEAHRTVLDGQMLRYDGDRGLVQEVVAASGPARRPG